MSPRAPIQYRDFYDIPRMFIVEFNGFQFLFDGSFDDVIDDYPEEYTVSLLPNLTQNQLEGSWERIGERPLRQLGRVPTSSVQFDVTRRKTIETTLLQELLAAPPARESA
jgi:hypothetical protein